MLRACRCFSSRILRAPIGRCLGLGGEMKPCGTGLWGRPPGEVGGGTVVGDMRGFDLVGDAGGIIGVVFGPW